MVTAASYHQIRVLEGSQVSAGHLDALHIVSENLCESVSQFKVSDLPQ